MMRESLVAYCDRVGSKIRANGAIPIWWNILDEAGYPKVQVSNWNNIMYADSPATLWCEENVGWGDYWRTAQAVYFTRDEDAVNFALRWS